MIRAHQKRRRRRSKAHKLKGGAAPGAAIYTGERGSHEPVRLDLVEYDPDRIDASSTEEALAHMARARASDSMSWLNLDGIHRVDDVKAVTRAFKTHPLWVEDILNPMSRPKMESLDDQVLVVLKMMSVEDDEVQVEQVSLVVGPSWVVTFQEQPGDVWDPVRKRMASPSSRVRRRGPDYLLHALMDGVVDQYFATIDQLELQIDELENAALEPSGTDLHLRVHHLRQELQRVRAVVWPTRELVNQLVKAEAGVIDGESLPFFRDLYDHVVQVMDLVDASRDRLAGVYNLHLGVTSNQLNETMRVLTVVATVFIPLTFIVGVYGMNFQFMPEIHSRWGYPVVMGFMGLLALAMLLWFRTRRWL